jgi:PTS system mannose-specific IIB component
MASGILHFRVDDRMLHGIVATQWVPNYQATRAMVIDTPSSTNDITRASLKMACPAGVALSVLAVDKAAENIKAGKYSAQRVFVVFKEIKSAYELYKAGVEMPQLNLGNVTQNMGETTTLDKTVRVSPEEKAMLREMRDAGTKVTARFAVSDKETDVGNLLD